MSQGLKRKRALTKRSEGQLKRMRIGPVGSIASKVSTRRRSSARGIENKYLDVQTQVQTTSSTASINVINGVALGDAGYQRDGREVTNLSLELTVYYEPAVAANTTYFARALVVWDASPNGVLPAIGDILQLVQSTGAVTSDPLSYPNQDFRKRFTILRDHRALLPTSNAVAGGGFEVTGTPSSNSETQWKWHIPLKGIQTDYTGTGSLIANIMTGALYFIHLNQDSSMVSDWNIVWNSRLKFNA